MGDAIGPYALDWIEGVRYVEDIEVIPGTPWLVAAGMSLPIDHAGGQLYLVDTDAGRVHQGWPNSGEDKPSDAFEITTPVGPDQFGPHGIAIEPAVDGDGVWNLYAVHHGVRESIEVFEIRMGSDGRPAITWIGAIARRPDAEGNAVATVPGGLIASHYVPRLNSKPELLDGRTNGGVERWTPDAGWVEVSGFACPFPNGVAVSRDGGTYFLADTMGALLRASADGTESTRIRLPLAPDNLRWSDDGRLLTTGVRAAVAEGPGKVFAAAMADPPEPLQIVVVAIDPDTLEVETLLDDEASFGLPTTALIARGDLYLTSLFATRLARLRR
jgi:sugar lactone lactonase YvrE